MEWDVELGARTEHRHELVQGVKNAAVFMDVTTVDETSLVYVLGQLVANFLDHFVFLMMSRVHKFTLNLLIN